MSAKALATLRTKTLAASRVFGDYNFRNYFVQHTKDTFAAVEKKSAEEIAAFVKGEGRQNLAQMRRMATINKVYSKTPVFLDPKAKCAPRK